MAPASDALAQDILTRIINVHWAGGGVFSFAGNIFFYEVTPASGDSFESVDTHLSWLGGTSKDGETWISGGPTEADLAFFCCVRGKVGEQFITIAAGDLVVGPFDFGPGYAVGEGIVPAAGRSHDDGRTWVDAGIPVQDHILQPPNPATGDAADTASGHCNAVAYHPATQTFYVGASVIFNVKGEDYWEDRMYSGVGGVEFSQVYSEGRDLFAPFPGYKWPEVEITENFQPGDRLHIADRTLTTPAGPGTLFVVSFGPDQHAEYTNTEGETSYLSVKGGGTGIILGGVDIPLPMPVVTSVCGGMGHIVAVGYEDAARLIGPVIFVSNDDGVSWTQQLSDLKHENPGPGDQNSGSSGGSCSFSSQPSLVATSVAARLNARL